MEKLLTLVSGNWGMNEKEFYPDGQTHDLGIRDNRPGRFHIQTSCWFIVKYFKNIKNPETYAIWLLWS